MVFQPVEHAVQDVAAHVVGAGPVEVERGSPIVLASEVGAEAGQVGAGGAQVVEDHVEQDRKFLCVGGVDEGLEGVGSAVGFVHRRPQDPVVAPSVGAVEGVERHELDVGDAEVGQVGKVLDRGGQCALGGEGAHVEFVDDTAGQGASGPGSVGPLVPVVVVDTGGPVHAPGLMARARVGQRVGGLVEQVGVVAARAGPGYLGVPPTVGAGGHRVVAAVDTDVDTVFGGHPDGEVAVQAQTGGTGVLLCRVVVHGRCPTRGRGCRPLAGSARARTGPV